MQFVTNLLSRSIFLGYMLHRHEYKHFDVKSNAKLISENSNRRLLYKNKL